MSEPDPRGLYDPRAIEAKWQAYWEETKPFRVDDSSPKPKKYVLDMFPYPSGDGLHVGHLEGYTATDIYCRYLRMRGFNVLHPMGWDAFGLPAEQYAIDKGIHPSVVTQRNIDRFRSQLKRFGFSYDWEREVNTTNPGYYKWTQWIFLQLYKKGLAYLAEIPVNWCDGCKVVLANEEVIEGKCERKGHPVVRRPLKQWVLRITAYADRLLDDLAGLDWPESTLEMQRNWIGRSEGAEVDFPVGSDKIRIFTTRPDTLFGATYMVLAPEHPLVDKLAASERRAELQAYRAQAAHKSDLERTELTKEKTGVFTGAYAANPVNGEKIPVWIADYVLMGYGTGAIMAVPAHDERDFEFARKFGLKVKPVVMPLDAWLAQTWNEGREDSDWLWRLAGGETEQVNWLSRADEADAVKLLRERLAKGEDVLRKAFTGEGTGLHSSNAEADFNGLPTAEFKTRIAEWLQKKGIGKRSVQYRLRDWVFSRQRFWGEPIPVLHLEDGTIVPVDEASLPVLLPEVEKYQPTGTGESPLAAVPQWVNTTDPKSGKKARRETNTMPQWAGSCWYYLRFIDPKNARSAWDPAQEKRWMSVDLYVGGAEHAVLHLLYARFWHKVLYDLGYVSTKEPFRKLVHQGMILGEDLEKMSKSRGNVVSPDALVEQYGADSLRMFEMFLGPLEAVKPWSMKGVEGIHRFLNRVWRLAVGEDGSPSPQLSKAPPEGELLRLMHKTVRKVTEDTEGMRYNTAISQMMIFVNELTAVPARPRPAVEALVLMLAPYAPHLAEELWQRLGHAEPLAYAPWPSYDPALTKDATVEVVVQVNGKVRDRLTVAAGTPEAALREQALASEKVRQLMAGRAPKKVIVVPDKLVNVVG